MKLWNPINSVIKLIEDVCLIVALVADKETRSEMNYEGEEE